MAHGGRRRRARCVERNLWIWVLRERRWRFGPGVLRCWVVIDAVARRRHFKICSPITARSHCFLTSTVCVSLMSAAARARRSLRSRRLFLRLRPTTRSPAVTSAWCKRSLAAVSACCATTIAVSAAPPASFRKSATGSTSTTEHATSASVQINCTSTTAPSSSVLDGASPMLSTGAAGRRVENRRMR